MEKLLEVKDLHTSFFTPAGEVKAVNGISFSLERGKVLGIVGESGSGKSVTAYSILQILANPGKIYSDGMLRSYMKRADSEDFVNLEELMEALKSQESFLQAGLIVMKRMIITSG